MVRSYMYENKNENRRRQRETEQFQLRQQRREDALNKKRTTTVSETSRIPNFGMLRKNLTSNNLKDVFQGTYEFRVLLSVEMLPPIQEVVDTNLVPRFVELLSSSNALYRCEDEELVRATKLEAAWVLTNIASGSSAQTQTVVDCGAIPLLLQMLKEEDSLADQAVWALGNIAGDSEAMRDAIIHCNCIDAIIQLFSKKDIKIVRNATWLLSNLCRGRSPPPEIGHLRRCLPVFVHLMAYEDLDVLCDSFWALSYVCEIDPSLLVDGSSESDGDADGIAKGQIMGLAESRKHTYSDIVLNRARNFLEKECIRATGPIVRMLGNIATGDEHQTDVIVSKGFLPLLQHTFYNYSDYKKLPRIRKEICWTISNICAGTYEQAEAVIKSDLLPLLVEALNLPEMYVRTEACWALTNCIDYINAENFDVFLKQETIRELREFLVVANSMADLQAQILDAFKKMLLFGKELERKSGRDIIKEKFFELDVVTDIEELQMSGDRSVSDRAYELILDFFDSN